MSEGCKLCPRKCGADRTTHHSSLITHHSSFCGASADLEVASVCLHRGEEPPLNPIVNIFFAHCNLQCIYCQNWQISSLPSTHHSSLITHHSSLITHHSSLITHHSSLITHHSIDSLADLILSKLPTANCQLPTLLGFVTAAHYADRIPAIVDAVRSKLPTTHYPLPTIVYNSSGYESVETLRSLEGLVDIYLPDFKYMDHDLARRYSHAPDYAEVASAALEEMIRQVGIGLKIDENGTAYRGLIVRHLVLPGHIDNSIAVLHHLAQLSTTHYTLPTLSLMAQYYPPQPNLPSPLDRCLTPEEYATVANLYNKLGFDGWLQELQAENNYRPDFSQNNPFEK